MNANTFLNFWKFPDELAALCSVGDGWSAIGCNAPDICRDAIVPKKTLHTIEGSHVYAAVSAHVPGSEWQPMVTSVDGVVLLWSNRLQTRFLFPFDVNEAIEDLLGERYREQDVRSGVLQWLHKSYYKVRRWVPRPVQMGMKRGYCRVQSRLKFPAWPYESSLLWLQRLIAWTVIRASGRLELPHISFWPDGKRLCVVLTHDVETERGVENIAPIVAIEKRLNVRSSWNFVPERYNCDRNILLQLQEDGFEVGVHGLTHDGRLFESEAIFRKRARKINEYARMWGSRGFRSPACHRKYDWMKSGALDFAYDSSYPDSDPYQPMPGGCSSIFPWFLGNMVELPITLPQDHVVFDILGGSVELWRQKLDYVEDAGGLALLIVHPDYTVKPDRLEHYEAFLEHIQSRPGVWAALPHEVASWWRCRANSLLTSGTGLPSVTTAGQDEELGDHAPTVTWLAAGPRPGELLESRLKTEPDFSHA
jgi:peptidoglycan/xylan/chitin deacetylase (PgdA/CDA1 family)